MGQRLKTRFYIPEVFCVRISVSFNLNKKGLSFKASTCRYYIKKLSLCANLSLSPGDGLEFLEESDIRV